MDDVGLCLGEHLVHAVVERGQAVAGGELLGHQELEVDGGDDARDVRHLLELFDVAVGDLAAPDDRDLERLGAAHAVPPVALLSLSAACAAARRAIGTRNGEHEM